MYVFPLLVHEPWVHTGREPAHLTEAPASSYDSVIWSADMCFGSTRPRLASLPSCSYCLLTLRMSGAANI